MSTLDRIGYKVPTGVGDIVDVVADTVEDDGMVFELYESGIMGAYHDAVGLVTYYRFDSLDAAYEYLASRDC